MKTDTLQSIAGTFQCLKDNQFVTLALKGLQILLVFGVVVFLSSKLENVGWDRVMASLPDTPWFYVFFTITFLAYPLAEQRVYRMLWAGEAPMSFGVFLRMRVYNLAVLSYSGEAFLAMWAQRNSSMRNRRIFSSIKDSNILSALASNSFTILLLALLFSTNQLHFITDADAQFEYYLGLAFAVGIVLVPLVIHFKNHILALDAATAKHVFLIHLARQIITLLAQVAMWAIAVPEAPLDAWLLLLTAQLVLTRVPFLPNTDLLLAGLGVTMMGMLDAPKAELAGMFFAAGVLGQIYNLGAFALAHLPGMNRDNSLTTEKV
ncbi:MAG: hypothetical protein HWE25_02055 [Alphaproteobacteria bacterium]|nr:hypothetical protein [Alphaproteobacteria bacterium]